MEATKKQISEWKKKYGEVYQIEVDGKHCYLHRPDRKTLGYASSVAANDPIKFNEIILKGCWIAGDDDMQSDDQLFLSVSGKLDALVQVQEAELVKL